jgi:hypothetical protein
MINTIKLTVNRPIKNKQNYRPKWHRLVLRNQFFVRTYTLEGTEAMSFTPKRSADHPYHFDIGNPPRVWYKQLISQ